MNHFPLDKGLCIVSATDPERKGSQPKLCIDMLAQPETLKALEARGIAFHPNEAAYKYREAPFYHGKAIRIDILSAATPEEQQAALKELMAKLEKPLHDCLDDSLFHSWLSEVATNNIDLYKSAKLSADGSAAAACGRTEWGADAVLIEGHPLTDAIAFIRHDVSFRTAPIVRFHIKGKDHYQGNTPDPMKAKNAATAAELLTEANIPFSKRSGGGSYEVFLKNPKDLPKTLEALKFDPHTAKIACDLSAETIRLYEESEQAKKSGGTAVERLERETSARRTENSL